MDVDGKRALLCILCPVRWCLHLISKIPSVVPFTFLKLLLLNCLFFQFLLINIVHLHLIFSKFTVCVFPSQIELCPSYKGCVMEMVGVVKNLISVSSTFCKSKAKQWSLAYLGSLGSVLLDPASMPNGPGFQSIVYHFRNLLSYLCQLEFSTTVKSTCSLPPRHLSFHIHLLMCKYMAIS